MNLNDYRLIIINTSGGKDSICAMWEVLSIAKEQNYSLSNIVLSHQDLGEMEWRGTKELVQNHSEMFGLKTYYSKRRNSEGTEETLLDYVLRRKMWPSNKQRWCTSDFKRGPGARVVTELTKTLGECNVLYVFGFRADESPSRKKKSVFEINKQLTTKKRKVYNWLPIHDWSIDKVWSTIKENNIHYHYAYDLGMPRLSCCFCIFSPFNALVVAGKHNQELLKKYIDVEKEIGHDFRKGFRIESVMEAIQNDFTPLEIEDWRM